MQDFTTLFIQFTKEFETPTSFWRWASYSVLGAVLRDSIYYDHGLRRTYPNTYIVLLADSAEYRKSGPFHIIADLLEEVKNTKIIRGRASIQSIIDDLSQDNIANKNTGTPIKGGSCLLIADELASFFVSDPQLIPLVTDLYDYRENWSYNLKQGKAHVKKLCVSLLAASNEQFLREVYTAAAVYGGLLGRSFMIKPDETRPPNDLLDIEIEKYKLKPLIESLNEVKKLHGRATATDSAKKLYRDWYNKLYESYKKYPDKTGVTQRMHTGALKLALIVTAGHYTIEIQEAFMEEAIFRVTELKSNYETYAMSAGKSEQAEIGVTFLNALWEAPNHIQTRRKILMDHWHTFSVEELDNLVQTLEAAGLIKCEISTEIHYQMTQQCIEIFQKKHENGKK